MEVYPGGSDGFQIPTEENVSLTASALPDVVDGSDGCLAFNLEVRTVDLNIGFMGRLSDDRLAELMNRRPVRVVSMVAMEDFLMPQQEGRRNNVVEINQEGENQINDESDDENNDESEENTATNIQQANLQQVNSKINIELLLSATNALSASHPRSRPPSSSSSSSSSPSSSSSQIIDLCESPNFDTVTAPVVSTSANASSIASRIPIPVRNQSAIVSTPPEPLSRLRPNGRRQSRIPIRTTRPNRHRNFARNSQIASLVIPNHTFETLFYNNIIDGRLRPKCYFDTFDGISENKKPTVDILKIDLKKKIHVVVLMSS